MSDIKNDQRQSLLRRAEDLADRCDRTGTVTSTGFLTPAEQYELQRWADGRADIKLRMDGGRDWCERKAAFFLPFWMEAEDFSAAEYLRVLHIRAFFGEPSHRDYLGAALGLGIQLEWLGDIQIGEKEAWMFCLPSVERLLTEEFTKAGHTTIKVLPCLMEEVPEPERKVRRVSFTVKSPRLDAVASSMFGLSRTAAAELIRLGGASLNYSVCERVDAAVKEGDVISLRGKGKGVLTAFGGKSRKDRLFAEAEIYQ